MTRWHKKHLLGLGLVLVPALAMAQSRTSVGVGLDYSEGDYGERETSTTWQVPVTVRHESGPLTLKLSVPYVRSSGVAAAGGDRRSDTRKTQSGLGDVTAGAMYTAFYDSAARFGIDVGGKVKFATASESKELLTTGENDYSLQLDAYKAIGATTLFGGFGWTKKGDPGGVNFRDPWFANVGFSNKLSDANSWGATYDYRQKLTAGGDPISEAMLFFAHRYAKAWRMQAYAVAGFSDASPDVGVGAFVGYEF